MPAISSLTRVAPTPATVDIGGEEVSLVFDRNAITPYRLSQMTQALEDGDVMASAGLLAEQIISWDVTDDQGGPYEPSPDNIGRLPFPVLQALTEAITAASVPGVAEGNGSSPSASEPLSATSKPDSTNSQNGSAGSTSPPRSESLSLS